MVNDFLISFLAGLLQILQTSKLVYVLMKLLDKIWVLFWLYSFLKLWRVTQEFYASLTHSIKNKENCICFSKIIMSNINITENLKNWFFSPLPIICFHHCLKMFGKEASTYHLLLCGLYLLMDKTSAIYYIY